MRSAASSASSTLVAVPFGGCVEPELARDLLEAPAILGHVDRIGRRAENAHAGRLERRA